MFEVTGGVAVVIAIVVLLVLLAIEVPIGLALGGAGFLGVVLLHGEVGTALRALASVSYSASAKYALVTVPMYVLLGSLAMTAGIARDLFTLGNRFLRRVPGGLGIATVGAAAGFAAVTGSSVATVATLSKVAVPEMTRLGYPLRMAAGIVGASGTLGILIPPSIALVIYGVLTGESIAMLLAAGIIPGLLSAVVYSVYIAWRAPKANTLIEEVSDPAEVRSAVFGVAKLAILFGVVVGGIYSGWMTVTESGAMGAAVALIMVAVQQARRREPVFRVVLGGIRDAASVSGALFVILVGSAVFSYFFVAAGVPTAFSRWLTELALPPTVIVMFLLLALIPLGMFLDGFSILTIVVPLAYPVVTALGFDGIWFAILMVKAIELGLITPPVGLNGFVLSGSIPGLSVEESFRSLAPYYGLDVVTVAVLFAVPAITLFLPNLIV